MPPSTEARGPPRSRGTSTLDELIKLSRDILSIMGWQGLLLAILQSRRTGLRVAWDGLVSLCNQSSSFCQPFGDLQGGILGIHNTLLRGVKGKSAVGGSLESAHMCLCDD
ncbi:hypothetical protein MHYP_G00171440 [Metynnis hypsauchen]